jgi:hypothetical protein
VSKSRVFSEIADFYFLADSHPYRLSRRFFTFWEASQDDAAGGVDLCSFLRN